MNVYIRAVVRHPQLRQPANYFIVSLACSDLVLSLIYPVYNLAHLELQEIQDVLGEIFLQRPAMLSAVFATIFLRPSVCLSVCPSVQRR